MKFLKVKLVLESKAPRPPKGGGESAHNLVHSLINNFEKIVFKAVGTLVSPFRGSGGSKFEDKILSSAKHIFTLTILLLSLLPFCEAQKTDSETYVKGLFEKSNQIEWIKHYQGRIDDLTDIALTLGYDGEHCKGQLTYLRSSEKINLEGLVIDEEFQLKEMDAANQIAGIWEGKFSGKFIIGTWSDKYNSKGGKILLEETKKEATFPTYCGNNKWIRKYNGKIFGESAEMILQREGNHQIKGVIFFQRKNQSFNARGEISENDVVKITLKNQNGIFYGFFEGFLEGDFLKLNFKNQQQNKTEVVFSPDEGLTIGCMEYADYMTSYDITFPKTTNAAFNKWMDAETKAWTQACQSRLNKNKRLNKVNAANVRTMDRGFSWCTVDHFSKGLISGFMTYTNSWTPGQKIVPFNFDFDKNSEIDLEDIFNDDKDYKKFIKNYIKKEIKNNKLYSDSEFKKWVKKNDFSLFTIRKEGICFSTKFNMLYGQQSVTIPYRQLKPFIKKNSPVRKIFK